MKVFLGKVKAWLADNGEAVRAKKPRQEMSITKGHKESIDCNKIEIIIVSDNHMKTEGLQKVLAYHDDHADYFLHCGDSNLDHDHELMLPFITVRGNTDFKQRYWDEEEVKLPNGELIWMVHGHEHDVGQGVDALLQTVKKFKHRPSVILYGHTHRVDVKRVDGFLIINSGSIFLPRDGMKRTYAKLVVTPESYDVTILDVKDHSMIKEFQFPR